MRRVDIEDRVADQIEVKCTRGLGHSSNQDRWAGQVTNGQAG